MSADEIITQLNAGLFALQNKLASDHQEVDKTLFYAEAAGVKVLGDLVSKLAQGWMQQKQGLELVAKASEALAALPPSATSQGLLALAQQMDVEAKTSADTFLKAAERFFDAAMIVSKFAESWSQVASAEQK